LEGRFEKGKSLEKAAAIPRTFLDEKSGLREVLMPMELYGEIKVEEKTTLRNKRRCRE